MKKLSKIMAVCAAFAMSIVVSTVANAQLQTSVDYRTGNVTVVGEGLRDKEVSVKVYDADDSLIYIDQLEPKTDRKYKVTFNADVKFGTYKLVVNDSVGKINEDIAFDVFVPELSITGTADNRKIADLTELGNAEGINVELSLVHNSAKSKISKFDTQLMCALYDKDGKLLSTKLGKKLTSSDNAETIEYTDCVTFLHSDLSGAVLLKTFLWESSTLYPYIGSYKLTDEKQEEPLKFLVIGNSFCDNSCRYLYEIIDQIGIGDCTVGYTYSGGATLQTQKDNIQLNRTNGYFKNSGDGWVEKKATTQEAIADEDWDYVFVHQLTTAAGIESEFDFTYANGNSYLDFLFDIIELYATNPNVEFGYFMPWPCTTKYASYINNNQEDVWYTEYNADPAIQYARIVEAMKKKVETNSRVKHYLYSGTAVWNARNCEELTNEVGQMSVDGLHVVEHGCVISSLTWLKCLGYDISNVNTSAFDGKFVITERQLELMKKAAEAAYEHPYELTEIK